MSTIHLHAGGKKIIGVVNLPGSKSESNRALIINTLCKPEISITGLSTADDTTILQAALTNRSNIIDIGPAGTAMRFLTATLAIQPGSFILKGSTRMHERPIGVLVDALNSLGAKVNYLENEGFPPLSITGTNLKGGKILLNGGISSQFISALCLIAPTFENGLELTFKDSIISKPYLDMTLSMMEYFGIKSTWDKETLKIGPGNYIPKPITIEPDWSSASYWYSIAALSEECELLIPNLKINSLQGDKRVAEIYRHFGVLTEFLPHGIYLKKDQNFKHNLSLRLDFSDCPDLAQTVAVTAAAMNIHCTLTGLKSLRIKETDRISALIAELANFGIRAESNPDDELRILPGKIESPKREVFTYHDHRMAMAFAPLALITKELIIENPDVVNKSYPTFWIDLNKLAVIS